MTNATITLALNETAQRHTPLAIGQAIAEALAFGTDDGLYTYADETPYTVALVSSQFAADAVIGSITLGPVA